MILNNTYQYFSPPRTCACTDICYKYPRQDRWGTARSVAVGSRAPGTPNQCMQTCILSAAGPFKMAQGRLPEKPHTSSSACKLAQEMSSISAHSQTWAKDTNFWHRSEHTNAQALHKLLQVVDLALAKSANCKLSIVTFSLQNTPLYTKEQQRYKWSGGSFIPWENCF